MGTRGDFYIVKYGVMEWIGSTYHDSSPIRIPLEILIQVNPMMYEELVVEFLESRKPYSVIASEREKWPWPWADSRMTDYSYVFGLYPQAVAYMPSLKAYFDPIKVIQGEDLESAKLPLPVQFPTMLKAAKETTKELLFKYGSKPTALV